MSAHKETITISLDVPDGYTADLGNGRGEYRFVRPDEPYVHSDDEGQAYLGPTCCRRIILKEKPHWPECPAKLRGKGYRLQRHGPTDDTYVVASSDMPRMYLLLSGKPTPFCELLDIDPATIPADIPAEGIEL